MATDHLKTALVGLVDTLKGATEISDILIDVFPFFAQFSQGYRIDSRQLTIQIEIGDSSEEQFLHNESTGTDFIPTQFILTCDTKLPSDDQILISDDGDSLLDLEYKVLRALQSVNFWSTASDLYGWTVTSISRDVPVLDESGAQDFDARRFVIELGVDIILDRDDGPAR